MAAPEGRWGSGRAALGGQGGVSSILTITFTLNLQFFEVKKPFRYEVEALHFKTLVRSSGEGDPRS